MAIVDFIGVGTDRSGTTFFHTCLTRHPLVVPGIRKEVRYFDKFWSRGPAWFARQFPIIDAQRDAGCITGEFSPNYLFDQRVPGRIRETAPSAKLFVLLRNPVDALYSYYWFCRRLKRFDYSFWAAIAINPQSMLNRRMYGDQLAHYFQFLDPEQFLIIRSEDMFLDPQVVIDRAFDFLGVPRFKMKGFPARRVGKYPPMEERTRRFLTSFYRPLNALLADLLGYSFDWD